MLQQFWYQIIKIYTTISLNFYFKKIDSVGTENIPKKGALLFVANHKNALIDPILIATTTARDLYFLTRASAFKIKFVRWLLSTINMLPIYRLRDGKETLAKNEEIFKRCYDILNKKKSLLIFPEGTHDIRRWVRPLSKGFTRITFGALEQNHNLELTIIPVGLNYSKAEEFGESVSIYYGKPIEVNSYYDVDNLQLSSQKLKEVVSSKMKTLTTHISDIENYDGIIKQLGNVDYLKPQEVNHRLKSLNSQTDQHQKSDSSNLKKEPTLLWKILYNLVKCNSFFPWIIWQLVKPKIQEVEFDSTTRFAIGITAFPLFYLLQTILIIKLFGSLIGLYYLLISVLSVFLLAKSK